MTFLTDNEDVISHFRGMIKLVPDRVLYSAEGQPVYVWLSPNTLPEPVTVNKMANDLIQTADHAHEILSHLNEAYQEIDRLETLLADEGGRLQDEAFAPQEQGIISRMANRLLKNGEVIALVVDSSEKPEDSNVILHVFNRKITTLPALGVERYSIGLNGKFGSHKEITTTTSLTSLPDINKVTRLFSSIDEARKQAPAIAAGTRATIRKDSHEGEGQQ